MPIAHRCRLQRPPPMPRDALVVSSASMCPPLPPSDHHNLCPTAAASNDHQRVLVTRWWFPRLPCALHRHQRVPTPTWGLPWPPSAPHHLRPPLPPLTTPNESLRLVGGFLG